MKYIIELPVELAKKISRLISEGKYESISQFAATAVENQLLLEESSEEKLDRVIGAHFTPDVSVGKMQMFSHEGLLSPNFASSDIKTVSTPASDRIPNDVLWGQYNRIFPLKITVRVLANLLVGKDSVELGLLQSEAIRAAREIGIILKKKDEEQSRKYGNMLSAALPTGKSVIKAEKRFTNHFVGYLTRAGRIEGAPGALKLLNIFEDTSGAYRVGITDAGLKFASLPNPIIDEKRFDTTLGESERDFYVKHVSESLQREAEAMFTVLRGIEEGASSPNELNSRVRAFSRGWSKSMTNTIRAGIVSRLHELGLITRARDGIRVSYALTDSGRAVLNSFPVPKRSNVS